MYEGSTDIVTGVRTADRVCEVGWFADLCGGDTEWLGVLDPIRGGTFEHCRNIVLTADALGFNNILLPTSYTEGQEVLTFAGAVAPMVKQINLLTAVRTGEIHPPMLARHLSTLDQILGGRLTVNIINSALPGSEEPPARRFSRCREVITILRQCWTRERIEFEGEHYFVDLPSAPARPVQSGGPLLYFGGLSEESKALCAEQCDVYLMWPDTEKGLYDTMVSVRDRARALGRTIDFGLRIHVIVRETDAEAREYAARLMSRFDVVEGERLKHRTQDARSVGVVRQDDLRSQTNDDYIEEDLWFGIGRARSGCGAAIVGSSATVLNRLNRYLDMGIRAFVLSGYPLIEEAYHVARHVLPHLPRCSLSSRR